MEYPIILCEDNPEQLANLTSIINDFNMFHPNQYKLAFKSSDPHAIAPMSIFGTKIVRPL